jgi:hypothetical protein
VTASQSFDGLGGKEVLTSAQHPFYIRGRVGCRRGAGGRAEVAGKGGIRPRPQIPERLDSLEVPFMKIPVGKRLLLTLDCLTKQAERSIHPAMCPGQWPLLQHYYDETKRALLIHTLEEIDRLVPPGEAVRPCSDFSGLSLGWLVTYPIARFLNRYRTKWLFRTEEIRFIAAALTSFLHALSSAAEPPNRELYL